MKTVMGHISLGMEHREVEVEVEDDATEEDIECEVQEAVFNFIDWGFYERGRNG